MSHPDIDIETNWTEEVASFEEMGLRQPLLEGIWGIGFERPSGIQKLAIVPIAMGRETIAQAQSGTGKTATFSIGMLQRLNLETPRPVTQGLVLAPTRELAEQTQRVVRSLGKYMGVSCHVSIGGCSIADDVDAFRRGVHVSVGTPGRIKDIIDRSILQTDHLNMVVIDEADEMLSKDFMDQIFEILERVPSTVQVVMVSATMRPEIVGLASKFMTDPVRILVKTEELKLEGIQQYKIGVGEDCYKYATLTDIYKALKVQQCVIFVNRKSTADELCARLRADKHEIACIHSTLSQSDRKKIMDSFRAGEQRILVSTDLLGRGIDVHSVTLVVNYDIPSSFDAYLHRIGRSGRFGRKGVAINFVTTEEIELIQEIEKHFATHIDELPEDIEEII